MDLYVARRPSEGLVDAADLPAHLARAPVRFNAVPVLALLEDTNQVMTKVCAVQGTFGQSGGWWEPASAFWLAVAPLDLAPALLHRRPFEWEAALNEDAWLYGGKAMRYFLAATGALAVIAYSFGAEVVFRAASEGARIQRLITVGSPVRATSRLMRESARPQIDRWWHVMDADADPVAAAGAVDGSCEPFRRDMPEADQTVGVIGHEHGGILTNPYLYDRWETQGLAAFLRGEGYERAA